MCKNAAGKATSMTTSPASVTRHQIREMQCAAATLDEQPSHGRALPTAVDRHWRQDEGHVTTGDGVQLAVRDSGSRHADHTVIFLHGLCLSQESWRYQIDHLLRRYDDAVRVISYDHRGHGRSGQAPMNSYRVEQLADDLAQVLTACRVSGPLTLVGHSMGGMAALCYLARPAAERPIEPHGLVLVATAAGKLSERGLGRLLATRATDVLFTLIDRTPARALGALAGPLCATLQRCRTGATATRATLTAVTAAALATTPVPTAAGFLPSLRSYDQYHSLGSIRASTVIVSGAADVLTPPSHARDLAAAISRSTHVHIPTAGHMLPHESPHVINAAIVRAMGPPDPAQAASHSLTRVGGPNFSASAAEVSA